MKLFTKKSKKPSVVFLLERHKAELFMGEEKQVSLPISKDIFNNAEILDSHKFTELIEGFLTSKEITQAEVIIILGKTLTFEKDISQVSLVDQYAFIQKFLESVLFEEITHKVFRVKGATYLVATNREICESVIAPFESQECIVYAAIPEVIFEKIFPKIRLETLSVSDVFAKLEQAKQYSLFVTQEAAERKINYSNSFAINTRVGILLGIFTLLLAILGILVYTQFIVPTKQQTTKIESRVHLIHLLPTPTPSPTDTPEPTKEE